jgi:hypothetical protein
MLNQENLYQLIFKENWSEVLTLLYSNKKDISNDAILNQAAKIFEQEFFRKIHSYPLDRKDVDDNLDTLYILNFGKFYVLTIENYKKLIIEIVKRKPLSDAIPYAHLFPEEEICKNVLKNIPNTISMSTTNNNSMNWIEIYNRLFELINNPDDSATYFSGPRFIKTVKEFERYFPDYTQFLDQRNREGKSTSRKIFYYDILISFQEDLRLKIVNRILDIIRPFKKTEIEKIDYLLGRENEGITSIVTPDPIKSSNNPKVFISYSWDDETHKQWVLSLADRLCFDGIDVILDRYYLKPGKHLTHFVENSISTADRIVIIYTPNYKLKADKRTGGVGYEYSIMNVDLYKNQTSNDKIIPVLRTGNMDESIPTFMQQFIHIDARNDDNFENSYTDLLREIYNQPAIQKPALGTKPAFKDQSSDEVEKPKIGL